MSSMAGRKRLLDAVYEVRPEAEQGSTSHQTMAGPKRSLDEVVPPEFVAQEYYGGAYNIVEMPKRFMHGYVADKNRDSSERMRALEALDRSLDAMGMRVIMATRALIRKLDAEEAAAAQQSK